MTDPPIRKASVVLGALAIAALLCRGFLADALVSRGDEFLRAGDDASARRYFARAVLFDRDSEAAVERFTFVSLQLHDRRARREAIEAADRYLRRHPNDRTVRIDRGLAMYLSGENRAAALELARAAADERDFRLFGLAAHAALRSGDLALARYAFGRALQLNPDYRAARLALRARR